MSCLCSSVFKALLGLDSRFVGAEIKELHFQEDNVLCMEMLLLVAYLHNNEVPQMLSFNQFG